MINGLFIIVFILASFGFTHILVHSKLLKPIRPKHYFFHCSMCIGFWAGIFIYFLMQGLENSLSNLNSLQFWCELFIMGCISSGSSYALSSIIGDEGINIKHS